MSVVDIALNAAMAALGVATLLVTVRLVRGPSALDRLVAVDVIVALAICVLVVRAALTGDSSLIPVAVATSLVGFLGSTTVARFLGRGGSPDPGGNAGAPAATAEDEA